MNFIINNQDIFRTNSSVHNINTILYATIFVILNTNPTSFISYLVLGFIWLHGIFEGHASIAGRQSEPVKKNIIWMSADQN